MTSPDDMGSMYDYPAATLTEIRRVMSQGLDFYLDGPAKVSLFLYDNHTLIVENFNDESVDVKLVSTTNQYQHLTNLEDGTTIDGQLEDYWVGWNKHEAMKIPVSLKPHSYMAFKY